VKRSRQPVTTCARRLTPAATLEPVDEDAPPFPQRVCFRTETGSVYAVSRDAEAMRWRRLSVTLASGVLRSDRGELTEWPNFALGEPCVLLSEPINPPWDRIVLTTRIVAFLEVEAEPSAEVES
jgi:hypothetical protein